MREPNPARTARNARALMRLRAEVFVLIAGLALIALAIYQVLTERPFEFVLTAGVALIVFGLFRHQLRHLKVGPGGVDVDVREVAAQLAEPSQAPDLKLLIAGGLVMGWAETLLGTDHVVQLTAVNTGSKPLGVNSLGLSLSDGRYIPAIEAMPTDGSVKLPAILQPQQTATTWINHGSLRDTLHEEGVHIEAVLANMADGTIRKEPVPDNWKKFGTQKDN